MREIKFRAWDVVMNRMLPSSSIWNIDLYSCEYKENLRLMQYTGLKDKNGKEIYEGDLVTGPRYISPCQIVFTKGMFHAVGDDTAGDCVGYYRGEYEVIGNIYKNPDLLQNTTSST